MSADGLVGWRADGGGGGHRCAGDDEAGSARLPGRGDAGRTELAERLLASQGKSARGRAARDHAAAPRQGRHRRQQERRPDQAGLTFPAGRARRRR